MARPLRVEFPGALYLVTARALPRNKLYRDDAEALDFVGRLQELYEGFGVLCHGYCLIPSHYHLLLETPRPNLSRALHRLNAGFTATTNARRRRKGPLLQSRYRSLVIEARPWLLRLSLHLHLNPVRRKLCARPEEHPWSSAAAFLASDSQEGWLVTERVHELAGGLGRYRALLDEAAHRPPPAPWRHVWRQSVLGGEELRQQVEACVGESDTREIPGFSKGRRKGPGLDDVVAAVAAYTGMPAESVYRGKFQRVLARKLALYLARRFTDLTLREIGEAFGVDYTTVHMAARRVEDLRHEDRRVDELLTEIEAGFRPAGETRGGTGSGVEEDRSPHGPPGAEPAATSPPPPLETPRPAELPLGQTSTHDPEPQPKPRRRKPRKEARSSQLKLF
jgi:DNA-directed RNA polymerase specialized sigma24 family protein